MSHLIYGSYCFQCCFGFANIISNSFDVRFSDDATAAILVRELFIGLFVSVDILLSFVGSSVLLLWRCIYC